MKKLLLTTLVSSLVLSGCASVSSDDLSADVYDISQLNSQQETKTVTILSVLPAKVLVDNTENKRMAQTAGTILGGIAGAVLGYQHSDLAAVAAGGAGATTGAVAGSMVKDKVKVEGVSITYKQGSKVLTSVQAGRKCQFKPGHAIVITTKAKETRIQPNAECPAVK